MTDWKNRLEERNKQIKKMQALREEKIHNEAFRKSEESKKRFDRLPNHLKKQLHEDTLQPFGRTRDEFYEKYGYLPDVHGDPGANPQVLEEARERVKKDKHSLSKRFY